MMRSRKDLRGQKINHLTVIEPGEDYVSPKGKRVPTWMCLCDCQLELPEDKRKLKSVKQNELTRGKVKSCGCNKFRVHPTYKDLAGYTFGKFTVIEQVDKPVHSNISGTYWKCRCECGNERVYRATEINHKRALTCGECSKNSYNLNGNYGIGYSKDNKEFYFDLEDYPMVSQYTWSINSDGYVVAWDKENRKFIYMHRLVVGLLSNDQYDVDHKHHMNSDNRKENLRVCTHQENIRNSALSKNNTSGVSGVSWVENIQKWRAQIVISGKNIVLLLSDSFEEATKARRDAEHEFFGEYAYYNSMKGYLDNEKANQSNVAH